MWESYVQCQSSGEPTVQEDEREAAEETLAQHIDLKNKKAVEEKLIKQDIGF